MMIHITRPTLRIEFERRKRGLTQSQLGAMCGCNAMRISLIERGVTPTEDELDALSRALTLSPREVLLKPVRIVLSAEEVES